jgi:hypothetical protein
MKKNPNFRYTEEKLKKLLEEGKSRLQSRDYTESVKIFSQILIEINSENTEATFYRAIAYLD